MLKNFLVFFCSHAETFINFHRISYHCNVTKKKQKKIQIVNCCGSRYLKDNRLGEMSRKCFKLMEESRITPIVSDQNNKYVSTSGFRGSILNSGNILSKYLVKLIIECISFKVNFMYYSKTVRKILLHIKRMAKDFNERNYICNKNKNKIKT